MCADGPWLPDHLTNAELETADLAIEAAVLAETFDETAWGGDGGMAVATPLLELCRAGGQFPDSMTLLRTCLHVQSRLVRQWTEDDDVPEEQALLGRLAQAVRERAPHGESDDEVAVIAGCLSRPEPPILARVYEDPEARSPRLLLWGLMTQPASALQHPLENQLSEIVAFLIDRGPEFARGFLRLCDGERDGALRVAVNKATTIRARTRVSLPAPAPEGLPKRTTLFPDISIEGDDRTFQLFVEVKVDAEPHATTVTGAELLQPDAYAAAWRQINDPEAAKVRRVCTLTRAAPDANPQSGSEPDVWRSAAVTWAEVKALRDRLIADGAEPELAIVHGELRSLIESVVYRSEVEPDEWAYVQRAGRIVLDALVEEFAALHPAAEPSSTVTVRTDYIGRYVTVPVDDRPLRLWLYATPSGGRYNVVNANASTLVAIADQHEAWAPSELDAVALKLGLAVERDNVGYRLPRKAFPLQLGLNSEQAANYGRQLGAKLVAAF